MSGGAAALPRRQRNHLQPAAGLYRARAAQPPGRGADARSGEPQQAVDARDRRRQHDRHHSRHRRALGPGVRHRRRDPGLPVDLPHHVRVRGADCRRQCPRRQGGRPRRRAARSHRLLSRRRRRRARRHGRGRRRAGPHQRQSRRRLRLHRDPRGLPRAAQSARHHPGRAAARRHQRQRRAAAAPAGLARRFGAGAARHDLRRGAGKRDALRTLPYLPTGRHGHDGCRDRLVGGADRRARRRAAREHAVSVRQPRRMHHRAQRPHQSRPRRQPGHGRDVRLRHLVSDGLALARRAGGGRLRRAAGRCCMPRSAACRGSTTSPSASR